jgi:hypothetical protein
LAEPDVVGLGAGEVQQGGAEARRRHHPQVDLDALPGEDGGLGRSGGEHAIDVGEAEEPLGDLGGPVVRGRDQHVDVADVAPEAAHAAGVGHLLGGIELVERRDDAFGHGDRHVQLDPLLLGRPRSLVDGLPQVLRRLLPQTRQVRDATVVQGCPEPVEVGDAELGGEQLDRLGPEPRHLQQVALPGRVLGAELLELADRAGVDVLADPARDALADPADLGQLGGRQVTDVPRQLRHRALRVLVRADAEGLGAGLVELGERGELGQEPSDLVVGAGHRATSSGAASWPG